MWYVVSKEHANYSHRWNCVAAISVAVAVDLNKVVVHHTRNAPLHHTIINTHIHIRKTEVKSVKIQRREGAHTSKNSLAFNWICLRISIINWHAVMCSFDVWGAEQRKKTMQQTRSRTESTSKTDKWMETYLS